MPLPAVGSRGFTVSMGPKAGGDLPFRRPFYATAQALARFHGLHALPDLPEGEAPSTAWWAEHLPYVGAAVGMCWAHPLRELDAAPPPSTGPLADEALYAYGAAVADELQSEGWPMIAIGILGSQVMTALYRWIADIEDAVDVADFLPAPAAPSTTT